MSHDILILAEQREGRLHPAAAQIVTPAVELARRIGGQVVAVVIGAGSESAVSAISKTPVQRVVIMDDERLRRYSPLTYRTALCAAIQHVKPQAVLLPATFMGRDLAPRVAMRLGAALATDCVAVELVSAGTLAVRRPIFNGKAFCRVDFPAGRLGIVSIRANTFAAPQAAGAAPQSEKLAFEPAPGDERLENREVVKAGGEVKDVTEADIIVSGGRSLKSEENFQILYELARELDGAVGASRAACDAGYQPHSRQVGLTGKTVTPKLYIACGISGAIQHLAGMRGSKVIVAINTDKEAPMVKVADYAVIGDLFQVVPKLTEAVRKLHA